MIQTQYMTLLAMGVCGAVLGAVYDGYRIILREWRLLRWLGATVDFLFWIFVFAGVMGSLWWADDGNIRIYTFVLLLLGYGVYRLLFRKIVTGSTMTFAKIVLYICTLLYKLIKAVVVTPLLLLWRVFTSTIHVFYVILVKIEPILLWPFGLLGAIMRWALGPLGRWGGSSLLPVKRLWSRLANMIWARKDKD